MDAEAIPNALLLLVLLQTNAPLSLCSPSLGSLQLLAPLSTATFPLHLVTQRAASVRHQDDRDPWGNVTPGGLRAGDGSVTRPVCPSL